MFSILSGKPSILQFITLSFLLFIVNTLNAQNRLPGQSEPESFPDLLTDAEKLPTSGDIPPGTLQQNRFGFITCHGAYFQGEPPGGNFVKIVWKEDTTTNAAAWNNHLIEELANFEKDDSKELALALSKFQAGLKADPLFFPFLYNAGILAVSLEKYKLASELFKRAAGLQPQYNEVWRELGRSYQLNGENFAAVESFKTALTKNELDLVPYLDLGHHYRKLGAYRRAEFYFKQVLTQHPAYTNSRIGLAWTYFNQKNYKMTMALLDEVSILDSEGDKRTDFDLIVYFIRAELAAQSGEYEKAISEIETLLSFKPHPFFWLNSREFFRNQLRYYRRQLTQ